MNNRTVLIIAIAAFLVMGWYQTISAPIAASAAYEKSLSQARAYLDGKQYERAVDQYGQLIKTSDSVELRTEAAQAYYGCVLAESPVYEASDYRRFTEQIKKDYPTKPQGYELQFDWYYADGKYESCVKTLKEAFDRGVFTERIWNDYESIRYLTSSAYGRYDNYLPMNEGKMLLHGADGWSYSDGRGNTAISAAYQYAAPFGSSVAYVIQNGTAKLIDDCGNTILLSEKTYDSAGLCDEGLIPVCENHIWRYVNTDMEPVFDTFQYAGSFCSGVAAVKNDSSWSIICNDGNSIAEGFRDVKLDPLGRCAPNGYIVADSGNGYSLYDANMNLISDTVWRDADVCYGEYTAVSDGNSWGYIDTEGLTVIPNQYSEAYSFANGFGAVRVDIGGAVSSEQSIKMGLIDTNGTLVVPTEFDELSCVNESRGFLAKEDGIWHFEIFVSDIDETKIRR